MAHQRWIGREERERRHTAAISEYRQVILDVLDALGPNRRMDVFSGRWDTDADTVHIVALPEVKDRFGEPVHARVNLTYIGLNAMIALKLGGTWSRQPFARVSLVKARRMPTLVLDAIEQVITADENARKQAAEYQLGERTRAAKMKRDLGYGPYQSFWSDAAPANAILESVVPSTRPDGTQVYTVKSRDLSGLTAEEVQRLDTFLRMLAPQAIKEKI